MTIFDARAAARADARAPVLPIVRDPASASFACILDWRLREGSHPFPGRDGGTCINEAAVVAAGYEYRPIARVEHMPACFSRPICRYALRLNDEAGEAERQRLLAFVTRLACADAPEVERLRAIYIASQEKRARTFEDRLRILEGALAIGRQADPLDLDDVGLRMQAAKALGSTAQARGAGLAISLKGWFTAGKTAEPAG